MKRLRQSLLAWYRRARRDLPWRRTHDPYRIWLSEMMLQQTRVETVIPYYQRFLAAFPTVTALAAADQHDVLKLWAGLGYYSRARNLHTAAQRVVRDFAGRFPRTANALQSLPGIGRYSAAAIASIAFDEPVAALDGNIKRVLARLREFEQPINATASQSELWRLADEFLDRGEPGDFNQALMELGATVCTPRNPACSTCPLRSGCRTCKAGRQAELPRKTAAATVPNVFAAALAIVHDGRVLLARRPQTGLLAGLWELPATEMQDRRPRISIRPLLVSLGLRESRTRRLGSVRHVFTHRDLTVELYLVEAAHSSALQTNGREMQAAPLDQLDQFALSTLDRKLLQRVKAEITPALPALPAASSPVGSKPPAPPNPRPPKRSARPRSTGRPAASAPGSARAVAAGKT